MHAVWSPAKLAVGAFVGALLVGGCSSNQAAPKPAATSSEVTACHDFGNQWIVHGSTTTSAQRAQLMDEMASAGNANLRKQANAAKAAIASKDAAAELTAADSISRICYSLGLLSKTGKPT